MLKKLFISTFIIACTNAAFAMQGNAPKEDSPQPSTSKEIIEKDWRVNDAMTQGSISGEMSEQIGEERLPPEIQKRIRRTLADISKVSFTCPSEEDIKNSQTDVIQHDGMNFQLRTKQDGSGNFIPNYFKSAAQLESANLDSIYSNPRCVYGEVGGYRTIIAWPISNQLLHDCTVHGHSHYYKHKNGNNIYRIFTLGNMTIACEQG